MLKDPLPEEIKKNVVWRATYWNPDEAESVYVRSRALVSFEMHSPIIAFSAGIPAIHLRQPTDTRKGQMWRDVGLNDWLFEIEQSTGQQIGDALMDIHLDYKKALRKLAAAKEYVQSRQKDSMGLFKK